MSSLSRYVKIKRYDAVLVHVCRCVILFVFVRSWGLNEAEVCLLFDGTTQVELTSNQLINKVSSLMECVKWPDQAFKDW